MSFGKENIRLPDGEEVMLLYGAKHPGNGTTYLQGVRMGLIDENSGVANEYRSMIWKYKAMLAELVRSELSHIDAVVSPPSSRDDASPFRLTIAKGSAVEDLSQNFTRKGQVKAGDPSTSLDELINEFEYASTGLEPKIKSLLIVDESISSGKTIAATLSHLKSAGISPDCRVTVAVWAKMK